MKYGKLYRKISKKIMSSLYNAVWIKYCTRCYGHIYPYKYYNFMFSNLFRSTQYLRFSLNFLLNIAGD